MLYTFPTEYLIANIFIETEFSSNISRNVPLDVISDIGIKLQKSYNQYQHEWNNCIKVLYHKNLIISSIKEFDIWFSYDKGMQYDVVILDDAIDKDRLISRFRKTLPYETFPQVMMDFAVEFIKEYIHNPPITNSNLTMSNIKDSGTRRQFESGAVRDIQIGKGRCDLIPLDVAADVFKDKVLENIGKYMKYGDTQFLHNAIRSFSDSYMGGYYKAMLEVSKQYEDGCNKYGERNWEKGIPIHCYIDSGVRHYLKFRSDEKDERHDRAFLWNMFGAIWTHKHRPKCIDLNFKEQL